MKVRIIKSLILCAALIGMAGLNSCVKSRGGLETDFSDLQDFVIFQTGGLVNYTAASVSTSVDTVNLTPIVTFASKNVASSPLNVTIGLDDTKRTDYNAANGTSFQVMPSNAYKIITPTVTIPAGQSYAQAKIQIYSKNLDPSISYLLPVTITDASGKNLSGNLNTLFYHVIGNPLAGTYSWMFTRYNVDDTTAAPGAVGTGSTFAAPVNTTVSALGPTTLLFPEGYIKVFVDAGEGITVNFTNNNGTFSNFVPSFDATLSAEIIAPAPGFAGTIIKKPILVGYKINGDAANHYAGSVFRFYFVLQNSTGGTRAGIDYFVKQ